MTSPIEVFVDGERVSTVSGITVAAMLLNVGKNAFRASISGESRGPVCGMGVCYECRVAINGNAHQRACMRVVAEGMRIETGISRAR